MESQSICHCALDLYHEALCYSLYAVAPETTYIRRKCYNRLNYYLCCTVKYSIQARDVVYREQWYVR